MNHSLLSALLIYPTHKYFAQFFYIRMSMVQCVSWQFDKLIFETILYLRKQYLNIFLGKKGKHNYWGGTALLRLPDGYVTNDWFPLDSKVQEVFSGISFYKNGSDGKFTFFKINCKINSNRIILTLFLIRQDCL